MSSVAFLNIPSPMNKGWKINEFGKLQVDWVKGDIVLKELVDIMSDNWNDEDRGANGLEFHTKVQFM